MKLKNKKYTAFIIILFVLLVVFFLNLFRINNAAEVSRKVIDDNKKQLKAMEFATVETVEDAVAQAESVQDSASGNSPVNQAFKYQRLFENSIVVGDSITEGLKVYGYLTESQVFSKIGASVINGEDLFADAASIKPKNAFFSFGINDMGNYNGDAKAFVEDYRTLLLKFKKDSPKSKIFVNAIMPPTDDAIAAKPIIKDYKGFNKEMEKMCKKEGFTYIDSGDILRENPDLYSGDGIHVSAAFYPLWMDNMIKKAKN